jgi:hypothetical protein
VTAASAHLRGIVIAGALAALALALGFVTLAMNQSSSRAAPHVVLPLKARHKAASGTRAGAGAGATAGRGKAVRPAPKPDPNLTAALAAGLPRAVARALAATPVAVVQLSSADDPVAELSAGEARAGAALGGATYVQVNVDRNGKAVDALTRALGKLPAAPATLVYQRPAKLYVTLTGFNDKTVVQQAVANATPEPSPGSRLSPAAAFAQRANGICTATEAQLAALGVPAPTQTTITRYKTVVSDFASQFGALKAPPGKAAEVGKAKAALRRMNAKLAAALDAAVRGDRSAARADVREATISAAEFDGIARELGATACAEAAA